MHSKWLLEVVMTSTNSSGGSSIASAMKDLFTKVLEDSTDGSGNLQSYQQLHQLIVKSSNIYQQSALNDAQEVILDLIQKIHEETKLPMKEDVLKVALANPENKWFEVLWKDNKGFMSKMLHACLCVTQEEASDKALTYYTHTVLFVQPTPETTIQDYLQRFLVFKQVPKVLILSLVISDRVQIQLPKELTINNHKYKLQSIIVYISQAAHYITIAQGRYQGVDGWFLFDDSRVTFFEYHQLSDALQHGHPVLFVLDQTTCA